MWEYWVLINSEHVGTTTDNCFLQAEMQICSVGYHYLVMVFAANPSPHVHVLESAVLLRTSCVDVRNHISARLVQGP